MKKTILVGLAIFAVTTSGALAAKKPKASAAAATTQASAAPMFGAPTAADRALYLKNQRDSGIKPEKKK